MRLLPIALMLISGLVFTTEVQARHWHHHGWWHHSHHSGSGTAGRLGAGASPRHPEGPGNPASGK